METGTIIALVSLVFAAASLGISFWVARRDQPKARARAVFYPATEDPEAPGSPPCLVIEIANFGRRVVQLESMYFQYDDRRIDLRETLWDADESGRWRMREGDRYDHAITPENDSILHDEGGCRVGAVFFQDSLGRRYGVKALRPAVDAYLKAAEGW